MILPKSPASTLRAYCHYCVQSRSDLEVKNCTGGLVFASKKPCPFYAYRTGGKRAPVKVMRQFCLDCMGGGKEAVRESSIIDCLIYPFRFGKNPALARQGRSKVEMSQMSLLRKATAREISRKIARTGNRP